MWGKILGRLFYIQPYSWVQLRCKRKKKNEFRHLNYFSKINVCIFVIKPISATQRSSHLSHFRHLILHYKLSFLVRASAWLNTWSCASVRLFQLAYCLNDQAHLAWFTSGVPSGQLWDRRRPSMEDDLWWKTTFDGRRPLISRFRSAIHCRCGNSFFMNTWNSMVR